MPPLSFNDQVNLASMVGTWLGSAFTAVGLIAVYSQLQRVLQSPARLQRRMLERGAGEWRICLEPDVILPERGCVEQVAAAFSGWVRRSYMGKINIQRSQYDGGTAGTFSWSRLFAQCGVQAKDLVKYGGPNAEVQPLGGFRANRIFTQPRKAILADVRIDDGKVLYGFSAEEFVAMLLLAGFSPTAFSPRGTRSVTGFLGRMHVMNLGPFTEVAVFDPHHGVSSMPPRKTQYLNTVPVTQCLDLALGIIRMPPSARLKVIIVGNRDDGGGGGRAIWERIPDTVQLQAIGDDLQKLVGLFDQAIFTYAAAQSKEYEYEEAFLEQIPASHRQSLDPSVTRTTLLIAHAIDALRPWSLLPVTQQCVSSAMVSVLSPFVTTTPNAIDILRTELSCVQNVQLPPGWKSFTELIESLACIEQIHIVAFQGSSIWAANYKCAMEVVFEADGIKLAHVRRCLAVEAAKPLSEWLPAKPSIPPELLLAELCRDDHQRPADVQCPEWALNVYATFLWAWFKDAIVTDLGLTDNFQRRIFLG